jgi:hypothetical protein
MDFLICVFTLLLAIMIIAIIAACIEYKKLSSFIMKVLILLFIMTALAFSEDPPITDEPVCEQHPILFPTVMPKASENLASEISDFSRFLSDGYWPTNLSQNISRNLTG